MIIDVRKAIVHIENSLIMMTYYDHGKLIPDSFSSKFEFECLIDRENIMRLYEISPILTSIENNTDIFHNGIENYVKTAVKDIFSGIKLKQIDENNFIIDEDVGSRRHYSKERNSELIIVGLDNISIWSPTKCLFYDKDNDSFPINTEFLVPVWEDIKTKRNKQLELPF